MIKKITSPAKKSGVTRAKAPARALKKQPKMPDMTQTKAQEKQVSVGTNTTKLPATALDLLALMAEQYESLPKQLKKVARYIEQHSDSIALEGIAHLALEAEVPPSAVVRFAKEMGFSGFSALQQVFRERVAQQIAPERDYQSRVRAVLHESSARTTAHSPVELAKTVIAGGIQSMQAMLEHIDADALNQAVSLLESASSIWLMAARRSFPVGAYLAYALQHTDKPVHWLNGVGQMDLNHLRAVQAKDVAIAISFTPYASETLELAKRIKERGAALIAITDSRMGSVSKLADVALLVQENATFGFRSLVGTLNLAQSLFIALAWKLELNYDTTNNKAVG